MTKRHFEALAAALKGARPDSTTHGKGALTVALRAWRLAVYRVADACRDANPRFDRARFLVAAGVDDEKGGRS